MGQVREISLSFQLLTDMLVSDREKTTASHQEKSQQMLILGSQRHRRQACSP